jgi:hypothetical protein
LTHISRGTGQWIVNIKAGSHFTHGFITDYKGHTLFRTPATLVPGVTRAWRDDLELAGAAPDLYDAAILILEDGWFEQLKPLQGEYEWRYRCNYCGASAESVEDIQHRNDYIEMDDDWDRCPVLMLERAVKRAESDDDHQG